MAKPMNSKSIDDRAVGRMAATYISKDPNFRLPNSLRHAINYIFTKDSNYIKSLISTSTTESGNRKRHFTYKSKVNSVFNALCLLTFTETKNVKTIFSDYFESKNKHIEFKVKESLLRSTSDVHLSAVLFFQITENDRKNLIEQLNNPNFDLFEQKLASPFSHINTNPENLEPLKVLFDENIDWQHTTELYRLTECYLAKHNYCKALENLKKITNEALLSSPTIQNLEFKINAQRAEAEEAWNYFQKILN